MTRLIAFLVTCLFLVAATGVHKAAAMPNSDKIAMEAVQMVSGEKAQDDHCCAASPDEPEQQASGCTSLPLVTLPEAVAVSARQASDLDWVAHPGAAINDHLCGPGEHPPKSA